MLIRNAHVALGRVFYQRCFYLFIALISLISGAPLIEPTTSGRIAANLINVLVIVSVAVVVGRSLLSFITVLLLAAPFEVFHWLSLSGHYPAATVLALGFGTAMYILALSYLLQYVFRKALMTADKLYGAAAAYLMVGVMWAYGYALLEQFYPRSFAAGGAPTDLSMPEFIYLSFTVLTGTGFGDVTPLTQQARSLCVVEQIVGSMFVAILIARLVGVYPPRDRVSDQPSGDR